MLAKIIAALLLTSSAALACEQDNGNCDRPPNEGDGGGYYDSDENHPSYDQDVPPPEPEDQDEEDPLNNGRG